MRQLLVLLLLCSGISVSAQHRAPAAVKWSDLDTAFARVLKNWIGPGFAVAVVQKDRVVYAKGFGYRDTEKKLPVTAQTLFAIGSCTKAFTASLIGRMSVSQNIELDKPVREYLPELKFYNQEMNDRITLRDMMSHRTGLPRHDYSWYFFPTSSDSMLKRIQFLEPSARPGEKWQYNNFMYMAQGALLVKKTGRSWEDNVRDSLFTPLGMTRSDFSIADLGKDSNAATGYKRIDTGKTWYSEKTPYYNIGAMAPAGAINSSVTEMTAWLRTWIHRGKFAGREIIPVSFATEAMSSQSIVWSALPDSAQPDLYFATYGFGWFLGSYRGHYRAEHGGNIDGFTASTSFFPSDSLGIVVLCNQDGSAIPAIVRNMVADKVLGLPYTDWNSKQLNEVNRAKKEEKVKDSSAVAPVKAVVKSAHTPADFTGLFRNGGYGDLDIMLKHDSLYAETGSFTWYLKPAGYDWCSVYIKDAAGTVDTTREFAKLDFRTGSDGSLTGLETNVEPGVKPIVFSRIPKGISVSADSLNPYAGDYAIGQTTITISVKNGTVHMMVPGQPEYELLPTGKDKFSLKGLTGFSVRFDRDNQNKITSLQSIQPNGTFKAARK